MISSFKRLLKWGAIHSHVKENETSFFLTAFLGMVEDILLWRKTWISLIVILLINIIYFLCIYRQVNAISFLCGVSILILSINGFEAWLKYKHRTTYLKKMVFESGNGHKVKQGTAQLIFWLKNKWNYLIYLRETNHTKAYLLVNLIFSTIFIVGKYISGYTLIYIFFMILTLFSKIAPPLQRVLKKLQQHADSDGEFDDLVPEISDANINILSLDAEPNQEINERQSLDFWKPHDTMLDDDSDNSDNSSSLVTNLSMEKINPFEKDVETSDSSEDEYIPLVEQKEQFQSTLEVAQPSGTWSGSAYQALWSFTGAVANMVYATESTKRKRITRLDSSDGFEMIDKDELS